MHVIGEPLPKGQTQENLFAQAIAPFLRPGEEFYTNAPKLRQGDFSEARDESSEGIAMMLQSQTDKFSSVRIIPTAFNKDGTPLPTDDMIVVIKKPQPATKP